MSYKTRLIAHWAIEWAKAILAMGTEQKIKTKERRRAKHEYQQK
jgi:hypothetical protein